MGTKKLGVSLLVIIDIIFIIFEIGLSFALIYESRKNKKIEQLLLGIFILGATIGNMVPILNEKNIVTDVFTITMLLILIASIFVFVKRKIYEMSKLKK
jgi:uncharacterized membrane protein YhfC